MTREAKHIYRIKVTYADGLVLNSSTTDRDEANEKYVALLKSPADIKVIRCFKDEKLVKCEEF